MNKKKSGYIGLGFMVLLALAVVFGSDPIYKAIDAKARPELYIPGVYTGTGEGYGGNITAKVEVTAKTIESIEVNGEEETLLGMVLPGLTDEMIAKQSTDVDSVSGATFSSNGIKQAVDQALALARGESISVEETSEETKPQEAETTEKSGKLKDGTYTYEDPEYDKNGFKNQVKIVVEGTAITELTWDCIQEDGTTKRKLSMDGQYVMTEDGPTWDEQADAVAGYVLEHQSVDGLISDEKGHTDAVTSVSISLNGFVNAVNGCLQQAE